MHSAVNRIAARRRPCADPYPSGSPHAGGCLDSRPNASFYSGHGTVTGTSAGLLCAQHHALPLYGGPWDTLVCLEGIALMTATGLLRIASDNHWASDVVVGSLIGFATGFTLPYLLHFRGAPPQEAQNRGSWTVRVMPMADMTRVGLLGSGGSEGIGEPTRGRGVSVGVGRPLETPRATRSVVGLANHQSASG